jgi:hypothetical protein
LSRHEEDAMDQLLRYEHMRQPLLPRGVFLRRLGRNISVALVIIGVSLVAGMIGYRALVTESWTEAFSQAAMILSGMGPYEKPAGDAALIFAGIYAIYSGLILVGTSTLILAPIFHRVLHRFHVADDEDEKREEKADDRSTKRAGS